MQNKLLEQIRKYVREDLKKEGFCFPAINDKTVYSLFLESDDSDDVDKIKVTPLEGSDRHFEKYVKPKIPSDIGSHDSSNQMVIARHTYPHHHEGDHEGYEHGTVVVPINHQTRLLRTKNKNGKFTGTEVSHVQVHVPSTNETAWIPQTALRKPKEKTKYSDEKGLIKMWNYATDLHKSQVELGQTPGVNNGYVSHAHELIRHIHEATKDPTHPLNFENAHPNDFEGGDKDNDHARRTYYTYLRSGAIAAARIANDPEHRNRFEEGHEMTQSGGSQGKLSKLWKKWGATGTSATYKGDSVVLGKNNDAVSFSLKDAKSAQIASGSHAESSALFDYAHQQAAKRGHTSKEYYEKRALPTIRAFKNAMESGDKEAAETHMSNLFNYPNAPRNKDGSLDITKNVIFHHMLRSAYSGVGKFARPSSLGPVPDRMSHIEGHATHILTLPHMSTTTKTPTPLPNELDRCEVKPLFGNKGTIAQKVKSGTVTWPRIGKPKHPGSKSLTMRISEDVPQSKAPEEKFGSVKIPLKYILGSGKK